MSNAFYLVEADKYSGGAIGECLALLRQIMPEESDPMLVFQPNPSLAVAPEQSISIASVSAYRPALRFEDHGQIVGRLEWTQEGGLTFSGDADASARAFFDGLLKSVVDAYAQKLGLKAE